jgi:hypothetical protein
VPCSTLFVLVLLEWKHLFLGVFKREFDISIVRNEKYGRVYRGTFDYNIDDEPRYSALLSSSFVKDTHACC